MSRGLIGALCAVIALSSQPAAFAQYAGNKQHAQPSVTQEQTCVLGSTCLVSAFKDLRAESLTIGTVTAVSRIKGILTTDTDALDWMMNRSGVFVYGVEGNRNNIIATVVNNLPPNTLSFPTATTMVAYQRGSGNTAFSIYNENHAIATGVATAETAAFQDGGPSPTAYPFDNGIGTTETLAKGWHIGAGTRNVEFSAATMPGSAILSNIEGLHARVAVGSIVTGNGIPRNTRISAIGPRTITLSKPATARGNAVSLKAFSAAATGLDFVREGSTLGQFNYGQTFQAGSVLLYGIFMDATAAEGAENGAYIAIPGDTGTNLILKTAGQTVPSGKVLDVQRADGSTMAAIFQSGSIQASLRKSSQANVVCYNAASGELTFQSSMTGCALAGAHLDQLAEPVLGTNALKIVENLRPRSYRDTKFSGREDSVHFGFSPEEVAVTVPELVSRNVDGTAALAVKYQDIIPLLVGAVHQLKASNDDLRQQINELRTVNK